MLEIYIIVEKPAMKQKQTSATILEENLFIIQDRWPEIFRQLSDIDLDDIHVKKGKNTLVINNIQLTS